MLPINDKSQFPVFEFTIGPMWAIPMDIAPKFSGS